MADGFVLYSEVATGTGAKLMRELCGKPWADVVGAAGLRMSSEGELRPKRDANGLHIDDRPSTWMYCGCYVKPGDFVVRPIISGTQRIAGLYLQNF